MLQLHSLKSFLYTSAATSILWDLIGVVVVLITFFFHAIVLGKLCSLVLIYMCCVHCSISLGRELTPSMAFTAMTLLNILKMPLNSLAPTVNLGVQAFASLKRMHAFLCLPCVDGLGCRLCFDSEDNADAITVHNVKFTWDWNCSRQSELCDGSDFSADENQSWFTQWTRLVADRVGTDNQPYETVSQSDAESAPETTDRMTPRRNPPIMKASSFGALQVSLSNTSLDKEDVNQLDSAAEAAVATAVHRSTLRIATLDIPCGSLVVVVGPTGCGKSTLLAGLLGECYIASSTGLEDGGFSIRLKSNAVSYVPQTAWIQHATLRDNVLFGALYDAERYKFCILL